MYSTTTHICFVKKNANKLETNDGGECLNIVNVICMSKAMSSQTSLRMCNGTIRMIFEHEDPLARDNVSMC